MVRGRGGWVHLYLPYLLSSTELIALCRTFAAYTTRGDATRLACQGPQFIAIRSVCVPFRIHPSIHGWKSGHNPAQRMLLQTACLLADTSYLLTLRLL